MKMMDCITFLGPNLFTLPLSFFPSWITISDQHYVVQRQVIEWEMYQLMMNMDFNYEKVII